MGTDDAALAALAVRVGRILEQRGWQLATAESCTGGWIAKLITDVAGSSAWFERGFVTYSNAAKHEQLDVPAALLERHGAVSAETVAAMARGALTRSAAQVALSVSGVAGPGGGSEHKPVGTVWLGWALQQGRVRTRHHVFAGDREAVRRQAVAAALAGLTDEFEAG
ncbi:MAG: nicotinamide-nucleotide amidase [Candidatus Competibacterales bacterium]|nr:nicotinamide-nucleotide amidase [Candidatus Competibacterales bacterium]